MVRIDRHAVAGFVAAAAAALSAVTAMAQVPPSSGAADKRLFGIVIGSNDPGDTGLRPLNYADDDAIRNAEVLRLLGADTLLLVSPDGETKDRYRTALERPDGGVDTPEPGLSSVGLTVRPASAENLRAALSEIFTRIRAARAQGAETELFFWYSGHGARRETSGVLFLDRGEVFSRKDLYERVLNTSPANFNYLFIDACGAASFVSSRGGTAGTSTEQDRTERQRELLSSYVDRENLSRFPNVGVLFAATRDGRVHEWSRYEGGVFSFELRSALLNAADADGDQRVTFLETYAFLSAANQGVQDPAARMDIVRRIPRRELRRPLADWSRRGGGGTIELPGGRARHIRVSDDRETPLFETNKALPDRVAVVLPPRARYTVTVLGDRPGDPEAAFELGPIVAPTVIDDVLTTVTPMQSAERGDVSPELRRGLFRVAYGLSYYQGVASTMERGATDLGEDPTTDEPEGHAWSAGRKAGVALLVTAASVALAAGLAWHEAGNAYRQYAAAEPQDQPRLMNDTRRWDWITTGSLVVAGAAGLTGTGLLFWDARRAVDPAQPGAGTAGMAFSGRF